MQNGIIAINKPEGISSARVVSRIKKALNVKKIGHTGTLDPFATGLLLCAVNKATRISKFFLDGHPKHSIAILKAHFSFYANFSTFYKKRKASKLNISNYNPSGEYKKSIVLQYFVNRVRKFSKLDPKDFY